MHPVKKHFETNRLVQSMTMQEGISMKRIVCQSDASLSALSHIQADVASSCLTIK